MEDGGGGRRSLRYEFGRESNASTAGVTLGGILSIKETPSYRIQNRTLLDLIRDDPTCGTDSKKAWKMFREKLRMKLVGSACTTTVRILASHVHVTTESNRTTPRIDTNRLNSPPVSNTTGSVPDTQSANGTNRSNLPPVTNTGSVPDTQSANGTNLSYSPPVSNTGSLQDTQTANYMNRSSSPPVTNTSSVRVSQIVNLRSEPLGEELEATTTEENRRDGGDGGPATVKMSLMSLLEVDGSAYFDDDEEEGKAEAEEAGVGGGEDRYNNCCVCMIRHKGAAFIPCGHTFCRVCSRELFVKRANCPLCNNFIVEILDIF